MKQVAQNLNQALLTAMDTYAERICFQVKRGGRYQNIFYQHFQTHTFHLTKFFRDQGLADGERIVLAADNCLEWMVA